MYGGNSVVTSITKYRQGWFSMETGQKTEVKEIQVYWSFGLGDGRVSCSLPCSKINKTASDNAYLSDSLQGQLLHEVNFISFFQMFVLQN